MKRTIVQVVLFSAAITILTFYYIFLNFTWKGEEIMNRAQVARMMAALKFDLNTCEDYMEGIQAEDLPEDVDMKMWYAKYIAIVLNEGWMQTNENGFFEPGKHFNYGDLKKVMTVFGLTEDMISFSIKYRQLDAFVSKKHWCEVYKLLAIHQKNIQQTTYVFLGSPTIMPELKPWEVNTNDGIKIAEGISVDDYLNQKVEVFESKGHILCIVRCMKEDEMVFDSDCGSAEGYVTYDDKTEETDKMIRVILQSDTLDYEHEEIRITSDEDFYVQCGNKTWNFTADQMFKIKSGDIINDKRHINECISNDASIQTDRIKIKTMNASGTLCVESLERACGVPEYQGVLWIQKGETGLWMINEVKLEDYVAGVISSEMPSSYGEEALKAQAVCTRTYALKAIGDGYNGYPADVDDTVACQVYNNQRLNDQSVHAALETQGQVLCDSTGLISAWFFSTSCGLTSSSEDVWYDGNEEMSDEAETVFLSFDQSYLNLTSESEFRSFINHDSDIRYYEEDLPWFRWQVFIDDEDIEKSFETYQGINIGDLQSLSIINRGESGIAKALYAEGDLQSTVVYGEYNIRQILSPKNTCVIQQDGNEVTQMSLLPSGYFYMDAFIQEDTCEGYLIYGGGYGHGCGMSQNGAMKMAQSGKTYEEILYSFFPEAVLRNAK